MPAHKKKTKPASIPGKSETGSPSSRETVPVIGLGGSAGGIAALERFFKAVPAESGMAYVIVLHLLPGRESMLAEVLQRVTTMPVVQAVNGVKVEINSVYVIPPGKDISSIDGHLGLTDLSQERGKRMTVDHFFRTLADTHGTLAAAIVLSGADGDGALGIKRIKECGGLTIVQDPEQAEHPEMPRSAIATGMVDWVLHLDEMPQKLRDYYTRKDQLQVPPEEVKGVAPDGEEALREVLALLRTRTGRDFSYYKRATILRRVSRRMLVIGINDMTAYLQYFRTHQGEAGALLLDLLVSVTNFFRDPGAFTAFESCIPGLFKDKSYGDTVRVWVPGCATGEEAYSLAILLCEYARKLETPPKIQVFATDLDPGCIASGREGLYPHTISVDVSTERLRIWFTREAGCYRICREIRDMVLFAVHDLLRDAPFTRVELISCRNLLIYLNREAQERVFEIFQYSLNENGKLFLGSSETIEDGSQLFSVINKKHRIYQRRSIARGLPVISTSPILLPRLMKSSPLWNPKREFRENTQPAVTPPQRMTPANGGASWAELHYKLLERFVSPSVVVDKKYDIVHLSESAGEFLVFGGGEPSKNLLKAVHPGLRIALRGALYKTSKTKHLTEVKQIPVDLKGAHVAVNIRVSTAGEIAPDFLLVVFETAALRKTAVEKEFRIHPDSIAKQLEQELDTSRKQLQIAVEQYETSMEEVKAGNEELQAMNEELHSATEELETSREELQSINEELTTVNHELQRKVDDLAHANGDLHNLIGSTAIATIFLNRHLCITRFTPMAVTLFNLIESDAGRPLSDLTHRLIYPEMTVDAALVLQELVPVEREVAMEGGGSFLARIVPYRTLEDKIAGVVLTFLDITQRTKTERELWEALQENERIREQLEMAAKAKDHFLAVLSHELRTPLTPVLMAINTLASNESRSSDDMEAFDMIERNIKLEARLIDELLDLTRISRGKLEILREPVDIHAVIHHAIEVAKPDLTARKQKLKVSLKAAEFRSIGDSMRLEQIIWNLLKNASKFTPEGGNIELVTKGHGSRIFVEVRDNGIGIEAECLAGIFDAFAQANADIARKFGGLGLGLAIAKAAAAAHKGSLTVRSDGIGKGSAFTLELPVIPPENT